MVPDDLQDMIVSHDLAVAKAYFQTETPEPEPEPEPEPAPCVVVPEPMPQALLPRRSSGSAEGDVHNLSSALVEASLIALAAVLATRLLKSDG
jgi:hypothetical protein